MKKTPSREQGREAQMPGLPIVSSQRALDPMMTYMIEDLARQAVRNDPERQRQEAAMRQKLTRAVQQALREG